MNKKNLSYFTVLFITVSVLLAACDKGQEAKKKSEHPQGSRSATVADVTGKKWGKAERISDFREDSRNPRIALDSSGNAMVVWNQLEYLETFIRKSIWATRYVAGTAWRTAEPIETGSGDSRDLQVAMDPGGNAMAVWVQWEVKGFLKENWKGIWANRYVAGMGWGTAERIETGSGKAESPQVVMDPDGNALAVWVQTDGKVKSIWATRYVAGTGWGAAERIKTGSWLAEPPQVAMDPAGNAIAVWEQSEGKSHNIWANRYVAGTGWGTAEGIKTGSGLAESPQVAMDPAGNAMVVWDQWERTGKKSSKSIWANRYVAGTGWGTAELIETGSGFAKTPQVAMDPAGNAMVVWEQSERKERKSWSGICANRYVAGTGWGTAELIETAPGFATSPQVAFDTTGNAMVVWHQNYKSLKSIWANRYVAGAGWGTAKRIVTDNEDHAQSPQVVMDKDGDAILVWQESNGMIFRIRTNRFE